MKRVFALQIAVMLMMAFLLMLIQTTPADAQASLTYIPDQNNYEAAPAQNDDSLPFQSDFKLYETGLRSTSGNPFFILVPGYRLILESEEERLVITVSHHTKGIQGVPTRIVTEVHSENGKVVEISRNYFAASNVNNSVFYFGEDVDIFDERGRIVSHEGAWRAGSNGAKEGLIMPGIAIIGARHFQEVAPGVALDRAEIVSTTETVRVPAGTFRNVLKVRETTPLEPGIVEFKWYAPGVGLIKDGDLELVWFGRIF